MPTLRAMILTAIACTMAGFAGAETLDTGRVGNASQFEHAGKPSRGMTQARVEADYGQPQARRDAVGEPPISRWEYAEFVVFFEYDKVIHAVTKR